MELTDEILQKIEQCGVLGYPASKICSILNIENEDEFLRGFNDPNSKTYKFYQRGVDKGDFAIDLKIYELAKGGDLDAIDKFQLRKKRNLIDRNDEIR
jgi:hypothetical protein